MAPQSALTQTLRQVMEEHSSDALPQTVFLFTGEGVHCKDTAISVLKTSSSWTQVLQAIQDLGKPDAESFLVSNLGNHEAPNSPVVTVAIGILNADLWRQWGQTPDVVLGHSVGEIAAAYASGMLTVGEAIKLANDVGRVVAGTPGRMVHTTLQRKSVSQFPNPDGLRLAAINYTVKKGESEDADILSVTLCGCEAAVEAYLLKDPAAVQLQPQHPWHHPSFSQGTSSPSPMAKCTFISSVMGTELTSIGADHWSKWLQQPVLFGSALNVAATKPSIVIEMGAHPIMADAVRAAFGDQLQGYACSMKRKERGNFVRSQRAALPGFRDGLKDVLKTLRGPHGALGFQQTFAEQGITSQQLVPLADALSPYFPGLAVHDLYQHTSLDALVQHWDEPTASAQQVCSSTATALEVLGCSVRLPAGVDSPGAFWSLIEKDDKESAFSGLPEDAPKAAYVSFDAKQARAAAEAAGCEGAEAAALDPQHALALQLAQELWRDAGEKATQAALAKPDRVGVYIGAWQSVASNGKTSAYRTIGSSISALAPRVANAFNLQGPVMTVNTACSSALVAVDHALRDAKAGKIDFAIVGGVNLFGDDQQLFADLRRAGMLSPTGRCHTFSVSGDGYVRAEGGVLFLLHAGSTLPSRARILGSAVTQNSKQKPLSAVDPVAQERVIRSACADAGMQPSQLTAVELHGTGTPLGDPVEVSALSKAIGHKDGAAVTMTAAKMHVGHLESAAGGVGLLKAVLMLEQGRVPGFDVPGGVNPHVKAAMAESCLKIPSEDVQLDADAVLGVSSFGFAGSNAHVVVTSPEPETRLPKYEAYQAAIAIVRSGDTQSVRSGDSTGSPRDGETAVSTKALESHADTDGLSSKPDTSPNNLEIVGKAVCSILGDDIVAPDANFMELGVDSLGLAELLGILEDSFGAGCIKIDQIMEVPSVRAIADHLEGLDAISDVQNVANPVPKQSGAESPQNSTAMAKDLDRTSPFLKLESCGNSWIRATHVGSLPRPNDGDFNLSRVVEQQLEAGLDVINDGEWTRDNYIADVVSRIQGLRGGGAAVDGVNKWCCVKHAMPIADDMKDVPMYALRFTGGNGLITLNPKREAVSDLACGGHPCYTGGRISSLEPLLDALTRAGKPVSDGFYSVPSPGTLALFCEDEFFYDHQAYVEALGEALAEEFGQIAATGLQLQVDCPDLAMGRHTRWAHLDDDAFLKVAEDNVAALNRALRDVAVEQIRVHVCWGNYAGPHHKDISADLMWPLLSQVKAKYLLVEGANARHRNDIVAFERAVMKGYFKADQVIVPGMIDTTTARLEDPKMIAENLLRYVRAAGHPSRVMAGTDCGFATTANSTAITGDIAWMKLRSLAEGVRLATTRFIEQSAPVLCKSPLFRPTPFRAAVIFADADQEYGEELATALKDLRVHSVELLSHQEDLFSTLRWAVDTPLAIVGIGEGGLAAQRTLQQLEEDKAVARRPTTLITVGSQGGLTLPRGAASEVASAIRDAMSAKTHFDKRSLVLPRSGNPPAAVDVVIVGAGLLGLVTAHRCLEAGFTVAVLEQRPLVGGIWSMYANGTSQVNSSEGGYCFKEFLGDEGGKNGDNRDHSTAAEILRDMAKLGNSLKEHIFTCVKVMKVLGKAGAYTLAFQDSGGLVTTAAVTQCRGVVLCINDRVGLPRPLAAPLVGKFKGIVADGTADSLAGVDWQGKRVVIVGMGAFAVENVRTALEHGAAHVTVVARRHGTICPKIIDYLNFVKPWDEHYKHDTQTNVKQFLRWKQLYSAAGCTAPSCWPKQVKEDGHTISVSDVWFIGHHMKKLSTRTGNIACIEPDGVRITSQEFIPCDIVVGCIGFERSNYLVEYLTGRTSVTSANYLDKDMMYLADAEIDEGAFNYFFGSSVLEYGKFFSNVYVEGLKRGEVLGERLWGSDSVSVPISERKWNQYIAAAQKLIGTDPAIADHARTQVDMRTEHFWRTMPPKSFVAVNKKEWEELHQRLNGGVPVPKEAQLKYFFEDAAEWC